MSASSSIALVEIDFALVTRLQAADLAARTEANNIYWYGKRNAKVGRFDRTEIPAMVAALPASYRARAADLSRALVCYSHEEGAISAMDRGAKVSPMVYNALVERASRLEAVAATPCDAPACSWFSSDDWLVVSRISHNSL